jgi:WD40 repeat protein
MVDLLAFSANGETLATRAYDGTVRLWNVASRREMTRLPIGRQLSSLALSPDGRILMTSIGGNLCRWEIGTARRVTFPGPQTEIISLVYAPDGRTLATAARDGTVKLWSVSANEEVGVLRGAAGPIWNLVFSPDGKTLAAGSEDGTVRLWRGAGLD